MSPKQFFAILSLFYMAIAVNHIYTKNINTEFLDATAAYAATLNVELPNDLFTLNTIAVNDPVHIDVRELRCLQENLYWEARNQKGKDGWVAVGYVTINRVHDSRYPNSVCGVVHQAIRDENGAPQLNRCSFSWTCDGVPKTPNLRHAAERVAWERAGKIAESVMLGDAVNPVDDALFYHADYVSPYWAKGFTQVAQIETHIFYRTDRI